MAVQAMGLIALYSTSWENLASQKLAAKENVIARLLVARTTFENLIDRN